MTVEWWSRVVFFVRQTTLEWYTNLPSINYNDYTRESNFRHSWDPLATLEYCVHNESQIHSWGFHTMVSSIWPQTPFLPSESILVHAMLYELAPSFFWKVWLWIRVLDEYYAPKIRILYERILDVVPCIYIVVCKNSLDQLPTKKV